MLLSKLVIPCNLINKIFLQMKETRRRFGSGFKENAVLLSRNRRFAAELERELGIYVGSIKRWRSRQEELEKKNNIEEDALKTINANKLKLELQKKLNKANLEFEIRQNAGPYFHKGNPVIFSFILENEARYSIRMVCRILNLNVRSYHRWKNQPASESKKKKALIQQKIKLNFKASGNSYGCLRMTAQLQNQGYKISHTTVQIYMKELGLKAF